MIQKLLQKESDERIQHQNLIYAALAHDLKTPMTSVQGFSQGIAEGRLSEEELPAICDLIYKKTHSMNELVDTLFQYAEVGSKDRPLVREPVDIPVLVRDIAAEHYLEFEESGVH